MYDKPRDPPNERMRERLEKLRAATASTVQVESTGGSVFMLESKTDQFWSDTYRAIRDIGYRPYRHLEDTLYVEKAPNERDLERRAEAEKARTLARRKQ